MIQQQIYRGQSIWFDKISDEEGVIIYLRNVYVNNLVQSHHPRCAWMIGAGEIFGQKNEVIW
jgi:hypothetical protein